VFGSGEEMFVVRIDLAETVFLGANEVEGIGSAEEDFFGEVRELFRGDFNEFLGRIEPSPKPRRIVCRKLGKEGLVGTGIDY
jgi:hypothetical protein